MKHRRLCLNIREHFLTVRVAEHGNRLSREVEESPPLEILKSIWVRSWAACSR